MSDLVFDPTIHAYDHKTVKLGKGPAGPRVRPFEGYLKAEFLTPVVPNINYAKSTTSFGMMLNDQLGDCTIAGCGHAEQIWTLNTGESMMTLPDSAIEQKYELWCGYNHSDPSTDQGGVETDVLGKWVANTFWQHKLLAFIDPLPTNLQHVMKAIELFGGVYIGVQLPVSVQNLNVWDVSTGDNAVPGSWGGHCVFVFGYRTNSDGTITFLCVSWGMIIEITQAFWQYVDPNPDPNTNAGPYVDEAHALLAEDWLRWTGMPEGFDQAQLMADMPQVNN